MNCTMTITFRIVMLVLLAGRAASGQPAAPAPAAPAAPTVTILPAATGALIRSQGAGNASVDLGNVSYYKGTSAPGETSQKNPRSFVVTTRFALRIDCPGSPPSAKVSVTVSRLDAAASHAIAIDGTTLRAAAQVLAPSMPCGSSGEHRMDVEVPVTTPAGSIGSTVAFLATLSK
jgi:hypothetical protein